MNKEISIIVPIYNVEKYLPKCLDSLINQTYKNIKIYAVIDGSPDKSIDIVKKYAKKDKRIICINKENGGYGSVLEETIKRIDTDYFMICDPDDYLKNNAVETLITNAYKYDLDIVAGDKYIIYSDNKEKIYYETNMYFKKIEPNKIYENPSKFSYLCPSPHSKIYRTKYAKNIIFPKKINFTDLLLYILVVSKSKKGMYINKALSYYLIDREGNSSTDKSKKAFMSELSVLNSIFNQLNNASADSYIILYDHYRNTLIEYLSYLDKKDIKTYKNDLKFIFKLKKYKKEILNHIKTDIKRKKDIYICHLLFNKFLSYPFILYMCKKHRK